MQCEIAYLTVMDFWLKKEALGINRGTKHTNFLTFAINRPKTSVQNLLRRQSKEFPIKFRNDASTGLIRDPNVTRLLESQWPRNLSGSIPTVAQLIRFCNENGACVGGCCAY